MKGFRSQNEKAKQCASCGFVYYFNPSAAVACFLKDSEGCYLLVRRGQEPAKGTLDLPGGFVDLYENAEEALRREVREETDLDVMSCRYLFSIPNIYLYAGFEVHTLDLFFECLVDDFSGAKAKDDAAEIVICTSKEEMQPKAFGLASIQKAILHYSSEG
ncbi:NAD+ diphosphatase [Parabacteroides sp. PF5-9]|nr:NAD+ diphosphatase [Parabacteroides sp. PF5-9]